MLNLFGVQNGDSIAVRNAHGLPTNFVGVDGGGEGQEKNGEGQLHTSGSHFTRLPHTISCVGQTSASMLATIHARTSLIESSTKIRRHGTHTRTKFGKRLKRAWIDAVLDRLVKTTDEAELRTFLDKNLKEELPGKESRAKTAGIILRIWSGIPPERVALRDRAVALLPCISGHERIWLHWGMAALAYPFFRDTAEVVGRLLALQDDFTSAQVQSRMLTTWGDRATTKDAAKKLTNTLVDWEVLRSTKTRGHFLLARKMTAR